VYSDLPQSTPLLKARITEERKHAILFAVTLLSARKIIEIIDNDDPQNMGRKFFMDIFTNKAIDQAANILNKIDERWPAETGT
jgi:hypothetical protein